LLKTQHLKLETDCFQFLYIPRVALKKLFARSSEP
jgi:hypothetical protein